MKNSPNNNPSAVSKSLNLLAYMLPSSLLFLAVIAMIMPWNILNISPIKPSLPLIVLFFWSYIVTDSIPQIIVFLFSLLLDAIMPVPFGYHSLLYFSTVALMLWRSTRFNGSTLTLLYGEFILVVSFFYVISIIVNEILITDTVISINILFSWAMSLIVFWMLYPILNWSHVLYRRLRGLE